MRSRSHFFVLGRGPQVFEGLFFRPNFLEDGVHFLRVLLHRMLVAYIEM